MLNGVRPRFRCSVPSSDTHIRNLRNGLGPTAFGHHSKASFTYESSLGWVEWPRHNAYCALVYTKGRLTRSNYYFLDPSSYDGASIVSGMVKVRLGTGHH